MRSTTKHTMMEHFLTLLMLQSLLSLSDSLSWSVKEPDAVRLGTPATLEWEISLTAEETMQANTFSLILLEREMFLYSDRWQMMAVKQFVSGVHLEVGNADTFDIISGSNMAIKLFNVTDRDGTRFRCTFFSSFAAPKSIIQVEIQDSPILVRLVGGTTPNKGRVEVYRNGFWGTICSNGWDIKDASVVCKMLGYEGAWAASCCAGYGKGDGPIWLSDLSCAGGEKSLSACQHNGWGINTCDHEQDAGVICHNPNPTQKPSPLPSVVVPSSSVMIAPTSSIPTTPSVSTIRLADGDDVLGRVEIYHNETWGTICDDNWDIEDATVACRMLGFKYAWMAISFGVLTTQQDTELYGTGPIWLDDVNCTGNESLLSECDHNGWLVHNCDHLEDAGVWCADSPRPANQTDSNVVEDKPTGPSSLSVRLVNGSSIQEGRVEILYKGRWGTVCDDDFDIRSADVICRMMGFPGALSAKGEGAFGGGSPDSPILLDDLWCSGRETSVASCSFRRWGSSDCGHEEDAGVVCMPVIYVELLDGRGFPNQGRVSLFYEGQYGTICDDEWDINDAHVVCRMLGYPRALGATTDSEFGGGIGPTWLDEVNCTGNENTLAACKHDGWGNHDCNHTEDAGVVCEHNYTVEARDASCNFDIWYCGWENGPGSFHWTRYLGHTPSSGTGPSRDHTSGAGFYFYLEATRKTTGETATLLSPSIRGDGSSTCMVFYYHLKVSSFASLRVKVRDHVLWQLSGNQGDDWFRATVPLKYNDTYQVSFEGVIGTTGRSDVAIDDVQFLENTVCANTAETLVPSRILRISSNQTAEVGSTVTIGCIVLGQPTPLVVWKKDGNILTSSLVTGNLTLQNISLADKGVYECLAINTVANDSRTTELNVVARPSGTTIKTNASYNVAILHADVAIECSSNGYPTPVCQLFHEVNLLNFSGSVYILKTFTQADEGEYSCNCTNVAGVEEDKVALFLYEAPSIHVILPTSQTVNETESFHIYCNATGNPPPNITWSKVGENSKVFPTGNVLTVQHATKSDFGQYRCTATCVSGDNASALATVELDHFSPIFDHGPQNVTVDEKDKENVTLSCNATAKPAPKLSWIRVRDGSTVASEGTLLIIAVNRSHRGEYRCVAQNGVGNPVSQSAYLDVHYKPSSTKLETDKVNSVVKGNGRITLTCTTDANPPPTQYQFYHDGVHLTNSSSGVHVIQKARDADKGTYTCVPINILGTGTNDSVVIYVNGALSILHFPQNQTVNKSADVWFFCNATSYHPFSSFLPQIFWKKLGDSSKVFPNGERLFLQNVDRHDAGTYVCEARNGVGYPDTAMAVLNVLHKPNDTILEALIPDNVAVINASVVLTCRANAYPPVTSYDIYHNGVLVSNTSTGVYNISRALAEHNGSYVCVPYNSLGSGVNASLNVSFLAPCGVKRVYSSWSPQIVGGVYAKLGEWPWQAQLIKRNTRHLCGASILDHYWIVTAAHCVQREVAANLNITVGKLNLAISEGTEQNIQVDKIISHQDYNNITLVNDIALLKLQRPVLFNTYVSPICLPDFDFDTGSVCYVTGWGQSGRSVPNSDILQETTVPLLDHGVCKNIYTSLNTVTPQMRCAGALGQSQGTCKGDSGGPLACEKDGRWYLLGITSWGKDGCMDEGDPGVFADVLYLRNWIENEIRNNPVSVA